MPLRSAENACYRPSKERQILPARDDNHLETGRSQDSCAHDGECTMAGCGNVCVSYRAGEMETDCIGYEWLDRAQFCGCIDGMCSFFRQ